MRDMIDVEILLSAWGKWAVSTESRALGFPTTSPMFRDMRPSRGYESAPPFGIGEHEHMRAVDAAVQTLPLLYRLVISELYVRGGSRREVAERIGCSHVGLGRYLAYAHEAVLAALSAAEEKAA